MREKSGRTAVTLDGNSLTVGDIVAIGIGDKKVALCKKAMARCAASRKFLEEEVAAGKIIYGVNTSFGPMCNKIISEKSIVRLQENLIRSHAAGLGEPFKPYVARAVMAVRLNSLAKGYSGVRLELLGLLRDIINSGIAPVIPECGSVGASGDLVHLAHMALAVTGMGKVWRDNKLCDAGRALRDAGLRPAKLSFKEGLALINGTSAMTATGAFAVFSARKALNVACANAAFAMEIFGGLDDAYDEDLHGLKPHEGQLRIAETIRGLFEGSGNIRRRRDTHEAIRRRGRKGVHVFETDINVQDVYSMRCTPQVLAPVWEAIQGAAKVIETEANSSNDNPLVMPDRKKIVHGGNFHGQSVAFAMDSLGMAVSVMCNLSERRINKLLDKNLNEGLPEQLTAGRPGMEMGFMGAQYLATSTTAENRHLAGPVGVHSISCNASNQDVVSMGTIAARKAFKMVSNAKHVLTLETLANLQALALGGAAARLGRGTGELHRELSKDFRIYDDKEIFHDMLARCRKALFSSATFDELPWRRAEEPAKKNQKKRKRV